MLFKNRVATLTKKLNKTDIASNTGENKINI